MKNPGSRIEGAKTSNSTIKSNYLIIICLLLTGVFSENTYAIADALKIKIARGNYSDETVIRFMAGATENFDGCCDAWKQFSPNAAVPNLFTKIDSTYNLVINALPMFSTTKKISLYARIGLAGYYTISSEEMGAFASGACIVMQDNVTGHLYDLRADTTYRIHLPVITQNDPPRFEVLFIAPSAVQAFYTSCNGCPDGKITIRKPGYTNWQYALTGASGNVAAGIAVDDTLTFSGLAEGNYTLSVNTVFGCTESFLLVITQPTATGIISTDNLTGINIWSSGNDLMVETNFDIHTDLSLSLFDLSGKMFTRFDFSNIQNMQKKILLKELPAGLYFAVAQTEGMTFTKKLVKTY